MHICSIGNQKTRKTQWTFKIYNLICLPRMLEQGGQKSGFSLHSQFAYLESTEWNSQMSGVYFWNVPSKKRNKMLMQLIVIILRFRIINYYYQSNNKLSQVSVKYHMLSDTNYTFMLKWRRNWFILKWIHYGIKQITLKNEIN